MLKHENTQTIASKESMRPEGVRGVGALGIIAAIATAGTVSAIGIDRKSVV